MPGWPAAKHQIGKTRQYLHANEVFFITEDALLHVARSESTRARHRKRLDHVTFRMMATSSIIMYISYTTADGEVRP